MSEQEFPGNSNKSKIRSQQEEEKPYFDPVVKKPVSHIEKKHKFKWTDLIYVDDSKTFKEFIVKDLIIPNVQRATGTVLHGIVSKLFGPGNGGFGGYGGTYSYGGSGWGYNWSNKPYSSANNNGYTRQPVSSQSNVNSTPSIDLSAYVMATREDAERVLEALDSYLDTYDVVPVSAFFELIGIKAPYSYYDFGWNNLASTKVVSKENGWAIIFPKLVRIR